MGVIVGVDIGTGSSEVNVVDRASGELLFSAEKEYRPGFTVPEGIPNGADSDPSVWSKAVSDILRKVSTYLGETGRLEEVEGLAISGLYGGLGVPLAADGSVVRPAMIWLDQRSTREAELIHEWELADTIAEVTGNTVVHPYYGYLKLLNFALNEPEEFSRTALILPPCGYVIKELTGEAVTDTCSLGNFGGIFDINRYDLSDELTFLLGENASRHSGRDISFPRELFGRIVDTTEIAGHLTDEGAALTGLPKGIPVFSAGVDAPVSLLASGVFEPGENGLMLGTSWCWGVLSERESGGFPAGLVNYPFVVEGKRLLYSFGGGAYPGGAVDPWFKDIVGMDLRSLEGLASPVSPGSDGLFFHPHLMGERCPVWNEKVGASFVGLRASMGTGHLYRAVLEGGAYLHRWNMETAMEAGVDVKGDTTLIDGGANSALWRQILADVCGRRMRYLEDFSKTPFGTAMVCAVGLGTPVAEAVSWVGSKVDIEPDASNREVYDTGYADFTGLYSILEGFYDPSRKALENATGDLAGEGALGEREHTVRFVGGIGGKKE